MKTELVLAAVATSAHAQQLYVSIAGYTERAQCTKPPSTPSYRFESFSFTQNETVRQAIPVPSPTTTHAYGPGYEEAYSLLGTSLSTTTWGSWLPNATSISATDTDDLYGQAAWSSLWVQADLANYTSVGLYTTTVEPTPVPSSELVLPPRDYFGPTDCYTFPEDFLFGVAASAAQIEGAIALEGRGPTLMEKLIRGDRPTNYITNENYFLYKQDLQRLAAMGVKYYSFSIPWSRILPFTVPGSPVNQEAIKHYDDLINYTLELGMVPVVTMIHFDSPLYFLKDSNMSATPDIGYNNGGYWHPEFVESFVNYGKILLTHFADRVPVWTTFNEPLLYAFNFTGIDNVVRAHAELYHYYHDVLNGTGKVGFKLNDNFGVPKNPENATEVDAANRFNEMQLGGFGNPLCLGEQYPQSLLDTLPGAQPLTDEDLAYVSNTTDFFGIDPYTATVISVPAEGIESCARQNLSTNPLYPYCVTQEQTNIYGWNIGYRSESYVYITPTYLRSYLSYLWNTWRKPVLIGEFGFPIHDEASRDLPDQLFDSPRSAYYLSYLSETLKAIWEDGVHVMGAFAWSFMDNWEFGDYASQFGLQVVNRTSQERFYKKSFFDMVDFVGARGGLGHDH
ncbi:Putative Beta-1,4-glucosidase (Eurofung) [Aspergillus calidoustus]|uniref:Putative Beta-1,4-glucosidase (Eurofung) n=1 Tax=Aspergillus calidoustus TaxID=454130 RepID=A0A0U5G4H7_ASPCI|nr:Putative Beta-1,4-glucosidase (Eurofung) [Aspergillus calidoustus]